MDEYWFPILGALALVGILIVLGIVFAYAATSAKKEQKADPENQIPEEELSEEEKTERRVTVVDMQTSARLVGTKIVRAVEEYWITFEDDSATRFSLKIPKDYYDGFAVGMRGTLVTVNETLYGFTPDEN